MEDSMISAPPAGAGYQDAQTDTLQCGCGHAFPVELGEYGCPNCLGDEGPAT